MKKIYLLLITLLAVSASVFSQNVNVSGALVGNGTYPDLGSAFTAINSGAQTSATIVVNIVGNTTETVSAVLNQSAGPWTSLTISPSGGASRTISGSLAGHLVDLNGADNVTIDGLNSGGNALFIINNDGGGASSTIRFTNDASNNTIVRTNINGSAGNIVTGFGVIYFGTGSTTGNDNNLIDQCNISGAGGGTPLNAIYSFGTSTAIDNSGNTISANNISNFFSAGNPSNGMNINSGNSGWTINSNSFYQTATRTGTTANTHNGIFISSGNGYTITNNFIGGTAPSNGGSAWTFNGTVANRFIGISISSSAGATSSIQNNTISNFALSTSSGATTGNGIWCGISISGAGTFNVGTTSGNTIGSVSGIDNVRATSTTAGGLVVGINSSSTGNISIQNNTFGALTCSGITAAISGSITAINISGAATSVNITSNVIGNTTTDNMRGGTSGLTTGSSLVSGINMPSATSPTNIIIANNTIRNLTSYGAGANGFVRGIQTGVALTCNSANVTGNIISNLASNNSNVSVSNAQLSAQGIYYNLAPNVIPDISNNTIFNISMTNTSAFGTNVAGISVSNGTANTITKNKIYGLSNASTTASTTAPGTVSGIHIRGINTTLTVANNMISLGNSQTTNTAFIGIWYQGGGGAFSALLYYNSVNIEGTAAAGAQPSFGFYRGNFSTTAFLGVVDIRNNIFNNTRSGGTGTHIAIANHYGATASATGWPSGAANNNVLNASVAANVGWWTTAQTFANWKTTSSGDLLSVSGVAVPFTATPTADLHLSFGVTPTQIESGGVAISGTTTDYDNQIRPGPAGSINGGGTAPDIGADEIDAVPLDLFAPIITYTQLLNNACTSTRSFIATVSDNSGVNGTVGTRPRVYYKKSTDANNYVGNTSVDNGWKYVEASNATSPFSFTIDYSIINGGSVTVGDVIQYFVVAQDLSPAVNVAINSGTFSVTPVNVALTAAAFPIGGTINSYSIVTGLSTSLTVGAAGNYTSLTGAGGLFSAINANGLTGNTTVNILDASVVETGAVALNQIQNGACGLTAYTLLIKPNAATTSILTGSLASSALIRILSSNVTIDGSNNGTTSRDLTITNTTVTSPSVLLIGSTGTAPVTGTTLKNTIIINGANTASAVVVSDGATLAAAGYFNNITIQNNSIRQSFVGIYNIAASASGNGSGLLITGNDLNAAGAASIRLVGVYVQGVDGATISNNNIGNIANTLDASNLTGIWCATGTVNSIISGNTISTISGTSAAPRGIALSPGVASANINVTGNSINTLTSSSSATTTGIYLFSSTSGVQIQKNNITNIKNTNASGFGCNGIQLASTLTAAATIVSNNFISDVAAFGFAGATSADNGYGIIAEAGGGYNIDYNSINLNTSQTAVTGLPAAINITSGIITAASVNIRDNIFANNQTIGTDRYAIYSSAANTVFGTIDYNDYYSAGPNLGFIGSNRANLAAIQTGFGGNTNSLNANPFFTSATDLHLVAALNCELDGYGIPISVITTDYDGNTRDVAAPDMGADEFTATYTSLLAGVAGSAVCANKTVSPGGTTYATSTCTLIAYLLPSGGSAVNGKVNACVTLDAAQQYFNGQPYVQRHFDLEPSITPSTATGTVTLYFTDAEFVNYNTNNPVYPQLPTSFLGNADPNRANVRITQFHGVGSTNPTTPGNYPGTSVLITPGSANVIWNGIYWAVTFNVTGFSGFYLHTTLTNAPLPIIVNYLTGRRQGSNHLLNWKVTCATSPRATMTLERSSDSRNYSGINTITADAARCNQPFDYTDANPLKGMNYYRLKIVDADGKVTYSTTVALLNAMKGFDIISIAPNPVVADNFKLNVASAQAGTMEISIFDMQGRLVIRQTLSLVGGYNTLPVNVVNLQPGTYSIRGSMADDQSKVIRFVKQ